MNSTKTANNFLGQRLLILAPPLILGILEIWHPVGLPNKTPYESVLPVVDWWITLHLLQVPLFGLVGLSVRNGLFFSGCSHPKPLGMARG